MNLSQFTPGSSDTECIKNGDTIHFVNGIVRCRICGEKEKMNKWPITMDKINLITDFIESFGAKHLKCIQRNNHNERGENILDLFEGLMNYIKDYGLKMGTSVQAAVGEITIKGTEYQLVIKIEQDKNLWLDKDQAVEAVTQDFGIKGSDVN